MARANFARTIRFLHYGLTAGELHNADSWLDRFWPPSAEPRPTTGGMREPLPVWHC